MVVSRGAPRNVSQGWPDGATENLRVEKPKAITGFTEF